MIQYSSINDAWGYKDTYKKNSLNNIESFANKNTINGELITNNTDNDTNAPNNAHNNAHHDTNNAINAINAINALNAHHDTNNNAINAHHDTNNTNNAINAPNNSHHDAHAEHFTNPTINNNSCSFAEHFKQCDHCKDSFIEYFNNNNNNNNKIIKTINLLGLEINITKDVLKVIFILLIILIFVLLLSTVNISFKNTDFTKTKYYVMPQNMPYGSMLVQK
jgi:hypothetical protein